MILDINKQLDEILKEELLQAEVIRTYKNSNSKIVSINK